MSKGGQKLQSGRLTHLVDQQICWYGWCWLAVPFVVSVPFDDKICWYGQAFRINILCNRPILLMEQICATVVVQFLQCSLHCAMWPVYICKWLLGQYYCIVCLFVCCVSYLYCLSLEQLCEKDQVSIVETKPSFVAVVYPKTNRCDSKGAQARPGVIQKTPKMSKFVPEKVSFASIFSQLSSMFSLVL